MELQEQNIKNIYTIWFLSVVAGLFIGCSSSEGSVDDTPKTIADSAESLSSDQPVSTGVPQQKKRSKSSLPGKRQSSTQQFSVHADTVDVQRKKKQGSQTSPISVKASTPKKFYTVEVGAFRSQNNIKRHQEQLGKRFHFPVRVFFDSSIGLTRVSIGTFSTKAIAIEFMKKMQDQFPKDYPDLWISYWTK